jgi:hypothetical protein
MNMPRLTDGVIIAIAISIGVGVAGFVLAGLIPSTRLFSVLVGLATLAYLIYLLKHSGAKVGKVVAISSWILLFAACWMLEVGLVKQILLQAGVIWLVRSLYFHRSLFSAALDLGLISVGLTSAAWTVNNTGSLATAMWSFFLTQALFFWIPDITAKQSDHPGFASHRQDPFQSAHQIALDAVRKLTQL